MISAKAAMSIGVMGGALLTGVLRAESFCAPASVERRVADLR